MEAIINLEESEEQQPLPGREVWRRLLGMATISEDTGAEANPEFCQGSHEVVATDS